jgi:hypothetical protein
MSDLVTRYTKGSALTHEQLDTHVVEECLTYNGATLTLDQTHNRDHIVLQTGTTAIQFTATATLSAALDAISASIPIGWSCKISNNTGVTVTINGAGVQFNGGTGTYPLIDNESVTVGFDNVSATKGYFLISNGPFPRDVFLPAESVGTGTSITQATVGTVEEISLTFAGVSGSLTGSPLIRIGNGGALDSTGYAGACFARGSEEDTGTTGAQLNSAAASASESYSGNATIRHLGSNVWNISGWSYNSAAAGGDGAALQYTVTLAGALDIVGLAITSGVFDGGTWRVKYTRSA